LGQWALLGVTAATSACLLAASLRLLRAPAARLRAAVRPAARSARALAGAVPRLSPAFSFAGEAEARVAEIDGEDEGGQEEDGTLPEASASDDDGLRAEGPEAVVLDHLPALGITVARHVVRTDDATTPVAGHQGCSPASSSLAGAPVGPGSGTGKARVVWEYDVPQALELLQRADGTSQAATPTPVARLPRTPSCSSRDFQSRGSKCTPVFWSHRAKADRSKYGEDEDAAEAGAEQPLDAEQFALENARLAVDIAFDAAARPRAVSSAAASCPSAASCGRAVRFALEAYENGERIEYFSRRHRAWQPGFVRVLHREPEAPGRPPKVVYGVELLPSHQMRYGVRLDVLRPPLLEGELVEVFRRRNGGVWLPAKMSGPQALLGAAVGYSVELLGERSVQHGLPASRVRRRFPQGSRVEVYRGLERGWVSAVVSPEPEAIRWGRTMSMKSWLSNALPSPAPAQPVPVVPVPALPSLLRSSSSVLTAKRGARRGADGGASGGATGGGGHRSGRRGRWRRTLQALLGAVPQALAGRTQVPEAGSGAALDDVAIRREPSVTGLGGSLAEEAAPAALVLEAREEEGAEAPPLRGLSRGPQARQQAPGQRQTVRLVLVGARGLRGMHGQRLPGMGRSVGPSCTCEVPGRFGLDIQTPAGSGASSQPAWNHAAEIPDHALDDPLIFRVLGKDGALLGQATLESIRFHPDGFNGELPLATAAGKSTGAFLRVQVLPAEPELWTEVPILEEEDDAGSAVSGGNGDAASPAARRPEWVPLYLVRGCELQEEWWSSL